MYIDRDIVTEKLSINISDHFSVSKLSSIIDIGKQAEQLSSKDFITFTQLLHQRFGCQGTVIIAHTIIIGNNIIVRKMTTISCNLTSRE